MSSLDLSRVQFATTSIYHFLFVPLTIGLSFFVAILHTKWHRSGDPDHRRLVKFFGTLLVINIAVGVVTGLVQEFEFGMNWSAYSRFVGDVFGAPLAMEGLAAFFLESTFLGLWLFGWDRLPKRVHLACIWLVAIGTVLSAMFIMVANSWMQNPVGYEINQSTGRPELNDISALFTNPVFVWGFVHVLLASAVTGGLFVLGVSAWQLRRGRDVRMFHYSAKIAIVALVPAILGVMGVGSELGVIGAEFQPMKVAAAEAQWETCQPCAFSAFQTGGNSSEDEASHVIEIPNLLSVLATNSPDGEVLGLNELNAQYQQRYGAGDYIPNVFVQYWSMRVMAYMASLVALVVFIGAWLLFRRKLDTARWFLPVAMIATFTPYLMNAAGWILTETGRQPWIVQGLMLTEDGVSPPISALDVWISMSVFVLLYVILAIVCGSLLLRYARKGLPDPEADGDGHDPLPTLTY
ncbi:MAG: cytochrome ubiquinol oxidase subunit I [Candidatus Nanopelagicales bacterium]|nr:cytochrome ubiquinol oxidase subunit I [Candidatus Nanopelagicales bacterium]